jgi:hypothetical protein
MNTVLTIYDRRHYRNSPLAMRICIYALSFTDTNARKSNTEVLLDVINDCTIARFENFHVKPYITVKSSEFNRRMLTTHASVSYNKVGIHLALINWTKTSSCTRTHGLPKIEFAAQLKGRLATSKLQLTVRPEVKKTPRYLISLTQFNTKPLVVLMLAHKLS